MKTPLRFVPRLALAFSIVALAACGHPSERDSTRPAGASTPEAPTAPTAPAGGTVSTMSPPAPGGGAASGATGSANVTGKVLFDGPAPASEAIKLTSDPYCAKSHPGGLNREDLLVAPDKGLANVFVYVKQGISGTYPAPTTPVVLDQKGCAYRPHVFGVMTGQPIDILNSDETLHNVHAMPEKNSAFNQGMPIPGSKVTKTFGKPEVMVKIKCDVHGWMSSWAGVLPHPFFAVSGADGTFSIKSLPPGTYTIEAWHEKLGTQTQTVTVGAGESKTAGFTFKPAA